MSNDPFLIRTPPSGPVAKGMTPGYVLTVQSDGSHVAAAPGGGGGGGVTSWDGRTGAVAPAANDYSANQVHNDSSVSGLSVMDALNALLAVSGIHSVFGRLGPNIAAVAGDYNAAQVSNASAVVGSSVSDALNVLGTTGYNLQEPIGHYSSSFGTATVASGYGSTAEGYQTRAGLLPLVFTIAAGGTLVTIAGDWRGQFTNGVPCRITPNAPAPLPTVSGTVNSVAVFAAGATTFNLAAPIDSTTTAGLIVESGQTVTSGGVQRGIGAHAEGVSTIAQGAESHTEGALCVAYGPAAHAEGGITTAFGIQAHAEGESTLAYAVDSHAEGSTTVAGGFCSHAEGGNLLGGAGPTANGNGSHAEGIQSLTGNLIRPFTIVPGGTLVTIPGNVVNEFTNGVQLFLMPQTPTVGATVQATVGSVPVFAAGHTTFNLTVPISAGTGLQTPVDGAQFADQISGGLCLQGANAGLGAHAEGAATAVGFVSHAEGNATRALSSGAHAEGLNSIAFGANAHCEGASGQAIGLASHAEGNTCLANSNAAHAEGSATRAGFPLRAFTIAAGGILVTIAGDVTAEFLNGSPAYIGSTTPATSLQPVLGLTVASVPAFAAGNTTFNLSAAIDPYVTGGVMNCPAVAQACHAEGNLTVASNTGAHAEGTSTAASGHAAHAEGNNTIASGDQSHAEGNGTQATGGAAHAEGINSVATQNAAHAEGNQCTASGTGGAHAEGNICTASGQSSHAEGNGTSATGIASHVEGDSCIASGNRGHAEGLSCQARNNQAHAEGFGCFADGANSHAQGFQARAYGLNEHAESGGQFAALGDNQYRRVQLKASTPGAAPGETAVLVTTGAANNFLQPSTAYLVIVRAIATRMALGAAARETAGFNFEFVASVTSANVVTVSAVTAIAATILQGAGFVGATLVPSSGGANDLTLTFTIAGGLTVQSRITASVEYIEVLGT